MRGADCRGPVCLSRRGFLQAGLAGLSLPGLLRLRAEAGVASPRERTAIIALCCHGGISHIDTYDPKPDAPAEFRGPFKPIASKAHGMWLSELLPRHAAIADKFCLLRSLTHEAGCHANGPQRLWTGHYTPQQTWFPDHPDCLAITNYLRCQPKRDIPNYVGLTTEAWYSPVPALGPAYLGTTYAPFFVLNDPERPGLKRIGLEGQPEGSRLPQRRQLLEDFDRTPRSAAMRHMDSFQEQALDIFAGARARRVFDLDQEPARIRDSYGRSAWGQQCLLARRLVENGVDLVTVSLYGNECGPDGMSAGNWDDHAVNAHIFKALAYRAPIFDRCITALIQDLHDRGLDRRVLVIVTGEFGRTPRISYQTGTVSKVSQPGRDHWPRAMSILFAGGGIPGGQVIGATNRLGEHPVRREVGPRGFIATIYHHLGVDPLRAHVVDGLGRPVPILPEGSPIPELIARR
jgi:hypothetical protein